MAAPTMAAPAMALAASLGDALALMQSLPTVLAPIVNIRKEELS